MAIHRGRVTIHPVCNRYPAFPILSVGLTILLERYADGLPHAEEVGALVGVVWTGCGAKN